MNNFDQAWQRLNAAARLAPDEGGAEAPFGFAARVAALALAEDQVRTSPFPMLSLRAMGIACLLAVVAVAANYSSISRLFDDEAPQADDPVAALVAIAS
jgi:hypothetical protein